MYKTGKALLSILLTVAMLCGMLLPAGAWNYSDWRVCEHLITTDGVYWINIQTMMDNEWTDTVPTDTTVYSSDGIIWYTQEGYTNYGVFSLPSGDMQTCILTDGFISPDGGMIWILNPLDANYTYWVPYWQQHYSDGDSMYCHLSSVGFSTAIFTDVSNAPGPNHYHVLYVPKLSDDFDDCNIYYSMNARADERAGVILSDDGTTWMTYLDSMHFNNFGATDTCIRSFRSVDPEYGTITDGYFSPLDGKLHLENSRSLFSYNPADNDPNYHVIYLKALWDGEVTMDLGYNAPEYVYCMIDMRDFQNSYLIPDESLAVDFGGDSIADVGNPFSNNDIWVFNQTYSNTTGRGYRPIRTAASGSGTTVAELYDLNGNGIVDETEITDNSFVLGDLVEDMSINGKRLVFHVQEGCVYRIPIYFWAEGQSPFAVGSMSAANVEYNLYFSDLNAASSQGFQAPVCYKVNADDTVSITGFSFDYTRLYGTGAFPDWTCSGCLYDPQTGTLTMPDTISGMPVTEICNTALNSDFYNYNPSGVQRIILPETVEQIGEYAFGSMTQNVHIPADPQIKTHAFDACPTATICAQNADGRAAAYAAAHNMTFTVCSGHGAYTEHQHTFGDWVVTTAATCTADGEQIRTCSECGATEIEPIDALGHDYDAVVTEPTCTEGGYTTYSCSRCGDSYTGDTTDPLGHDIADSYEEVIPPTCTTEGYSVLSCRRCAETFTDHFVPALGHSWSEWTITTPPTATENGEQTRTCTRCDETETQSVPMLSQPAKFTVQGARAKRGDSVQVTVSVENNPGITAAWLDLEYDPQILTLTAVDNGEVFPADVFQPGGNNSAVPFTVFWVDPLAEENNTSNGTLVTFTFEVAADAPIGTTPVTITCDTESTFNKDLEDVVFDITNGDVTVYIPGDADGDGEFDLEDVAILARYLAGGWDVTVDTATADANGDGKVNLKDIVLMRRALAGWDVTLV